FSPYQAAFAVRNDALKPEPLLEPVLTQQHIQRRDHMTAQLSSGRRASQRPRSSRTVLEGPSPASVSGASLTRSVLSLGRAAQTCQWVVRQPIGCCPQLGMTPSSCNTRYESSGLHAPP